MFAKVESRGTVSIEYIIYLTWVIQYNSAIHCDRPGHIVPERNKQLSKNVSYSALFYWTGSSLTENG